ncbi:MULTISPECIES: hypothetical protein [Lonsdalea]|uniref:hypothetical protein n=1 Tax=Lonsdalea TaxID=1082702 RepID=UPI001301D2D8|nr:MULTISPECIES: hypothetical protein [Lonsdalea]QPQ22943.1 hypothetical protein I6N93_09575 [Lonsdalea populi]
MSSIQGDEVLQMTIPTQRHATITPLLSGASVTFHQRLRLHADARKPASTLPLTPLRYR